MRNQYTSIKISKYFDITHLQQNKTDISKETKNPVKKDTLPISQAVVLRCSAKKKSLKMLSTVYLHIIEIDISSGQQPAKICQNPDIRKNSPLFNILL